MALNWTTGALMRPAGCLPCCVQEQPECFLTLPTILIDGTDTPYADITEATTAIADKTANCLIEFQPQLGPGQSQGAVSASVAGGVLSTSNEATGSGSPVSPLSVCRVYLFAASDLSVEYNLTSSGTTGLGVSVAVYEDDGTTLVDSQTDSSPSAGSLSGTFPFTIPADGYYYVTTTGTADDLTLTAAFDLDGGADAVFCTVRAAYGGTPDYVICT